jgi:TolB-like protein
MSFLAEIKRRNVFRVATVYAATAFVVLQVASLTFAPLHLPPWAMTLVVVVTILGFPIALVLAWAYELTPRGIQRTEPADAAAGGTHAWVGKRTVALTAALVLVGVGLGAGWFLRPAASGWIGGADDPATLAVLPFENLSGDDATMPFVLGVHDDLLTHLSGIDGLEVISRTSVMGYEGSSKTVPEIARELGATAVLEGGIQRSGDRIRMNVQLIDARTDRHLWAERYDRTLTAENVFAIQGEIAGEIAMALRAALTPEERADLASAPTADLEALDLYYRGSDLYERRIFANATAREAVSALEAAVAADPAFAAAWAMLARARAWLVREGMETDPEPPRQALARARALAPDARETELAAVEVLYYN